MHKFPSQEKKTIAHPSLTLAGSWDAARQARRSESWGVLLDLQFSMIFESTFIIILELVANPVDSIDNKSIIIS